MVIDRDKTLEENYNILLRRNRELELHDKNGTAICAHCGKQKKEHFVDGTGRCSVSALSDNFLNRRQDEWNSVLMALDLIEQLRVL